MPWFIGLAIIVVGDDPAVPMACPSEVAKGNATLSLTAHSQHRTWKENGHGQDEGCNLC